MSRIIKYKAYHKIDNKIYQCVTVPCEDKDKWPILVYTKKHIIDSLEGEYELIQYTEKNDKYGDDIYEGYILEREYVSSLSGNTKIDRYKVEYTDWGYIARAINSTGNVAFSTGDIAFALIRDFTEYQIIGNIYNGEEVVYE